jgi:hypothetical protein
MCSTFGAEHFRHLAGALFPSRLAKSRLEKIWGACVLVVISFLFYCLLMSFILATVINIYSQVNRQAVHVRYRQQQRSVVRFAVVGRGNAAGC